jgi:AdoMet-dependent heme synthase
MSIHTPRDFFFQWHLTERCNLRCTHCYQAGGRTDELSTDEALGFIDEAATTVADWSELYGLSFLPAFNITGGEPLLRPDLFILLEELKERKIDVHLLTNGTLVDKRSADRLRKAGIATVQVSVEGGEPVHDGIRGRGSFRAALAGVKNLVDVGLEVTLNMTLSRHNAGSVGEMVALAENSGARRLGFSRLVPAGRGRTLLAEGLAREEVAELYQRIFSLETGKVKLVTGDPVAAQLQLPTTGDCGETPQGGCAAGLFGITVAADGTVMPCRRLPLPIGNIKRDSIRAIWASSEILTRLRSRERYQGKCRRCDRWALCRGCRAIAYAHAGDFLGEDPQCFLA